MKMEAQKKEAGDMRRMFNQMFVLAIVLWTAVCAGSMLYLNFDSERVLERIARETARTYIEKDLLYRYWAAELGGIYVPVTERTPANPYLAGVKERDITTPSGRRLTLLHPAAMMRQVHALGRDFEKIQGHMTSLKPLHPENAPDAWEAKALSVLESGAREFGEFVDYQGTPHYRMMYPLVMVKPCLSCHAAQGYKLGDLRGGIDASFPMEIFAPVSHDHHLSMVRQFAGIWMAGFACIFAVAPFVRRRIVEQEQAEEALQRNLHFTRSIIENEPECVKVLDRDGTVLFVNPAGLAMVDAVSSHGVVGRPMGQFVVPEHREAFIWLHKQVFAGESGRLEFETVGLKGTHRWLETHAVPIRSADGTVDSLLSITRDVTDRKRLEQQLLQSHKMETVGRLAGGIAHDINNMLMPILGYAELLKEKLPDGDGGREDLAEITSAARRVKTMTLQLLAFARKQTLEMVRLDLNDVVSGFSPMLQMTFREAISFTVRLAPSVRHVLGDKSQLEQVIMNLAVNARDAMPSGGTFVLATQDRVVDETYTASRPGMAPGTYVQLLATDTGIGMDEDTQSKIFEPFFTTKDAGQGTGLGLATVYGIIKQHNGYIEVRSELGTGTNFIISLPVNDAPAEERTDAAREQLVQKGFETVLVVEGQLQFLQLVSLMLTTRGYHVLTANSGQEALRATESYAGEIHLVVTDVIMPDMNGKELFEQIRQARQGIRVLYMSGYPADVISKQGVLETGINFLRKSFSAKELTVKVRQVLDSSGKNGASGKG
jgi:PAS domain S-box-containing protein